MATPRRSLDVSIELHHIHCIDEGDGPGNAEPYLWPLFFKVDGSTVRFGERDSLEGLITVVRRNGEHGNLQNTDVDEGDDVAIPPSIGKWETVLTAIPIADSKKDIFKKVKDWADLPGSIGVICILMEEDNLPDSAAIAGYNAFCSTFETRMNDRINSLTLLKLIASTTPDGEEEEESFQKSLREAITEAVESSMSDNLNILQAAWNWIAGPDQTLGSGAFSFTHDDLVRHQQISFNDRWKQGVSVFDPSQDNWGSMITSGPGRFIESGGEWKVYGHVSATPVSEFTGTFGPIIQFNQAEMAMRDFNHRAEVAEREGFVGGFPNFHTATYGRSNVGGTIFLKPGCSVWRDVPLSDLGNPSLIDFGGRFQATHRYATDQAFVGGFPNFFHAEHTVISGSQFLGLGSIFTRQRATAHRVTFCGTVLLKPGCAEFRDVPLAELGNPSLSDIGARFRATQDYAHSHGFVGGFPNFFHADRGNGIVCGTILLTRGAAEWRDVLLWLGPA